MSLTLIALLACGGAPEDTDQMPPVDDTGPSGSDGPLRWSSRTITTNQRGLATLKVDSTGLRSVLATAFAPDNRSTALEFIDAPDGTRLFDWNDWNASAESLTYAWYNAETSVVNWPVRDADPALDGGEYEFIFGVYDRNLNYLPETDLDVVVVENSDMNLNQGQVDVLIVYAEGVDQDPDVVAATEEAITYWGQIWGSIGIDIDVETIASDISDQLPFYSTPADKTAIETWSAEASGSQVVVFIGERVGSNLGTYGESGGIPGSLSPSIYTGVVVGWLACAGSDGVFSTDDIEIYGETLAHEVGHYLGLFHPVESDYSYWDALEDTPRCTSENQCENQLGTNLMFPYTICTPSQCDNQDQLTDDQGGVMQRYSGTR